MFLSRLLTGSKQMEFVQHVNELIQKGQFEDAVSTESNLAYFYQSRNISMSKFL